MTNCRPLSKENCRAPPSTLTLLPSGCPPLPWLLQEFGFRPASFAAAVYPLVYERFIEGPQRILLDALRRGNVQNLSAKQLVPFIPMGYKFFEAGKEGEYERNLRILAAFLAGELKQDTPDASNFARMVRRVENLSLTDLK